MINTSIAVAELANLSPTSAASGLRCFPSVDVRQAPGGWLDRWMQQFSAVGWQLGSAQEQALAALAPLLLCGEQSAQNVFHQQAAQLRHSFQARMVAALYVIEVEEERHERALQYLAANLPAAPDLHSRKRRAQRFYMALSRGVKPAEHFARIEALDSTVSRIMHTLSRAGWGSAHPLYFLFEAIKADEARHVGVSRRYARELGISDAQRRREREMIGQRVVAFLQPDATAFDTIGVDPDRLFGQLQRGAQS